jgi:hypothetical protein
MALVRWLVIHRWKEGIRSVIFRRNLVAGILGGILGAFLVLNLLSVGLLLERMIGAVAPDRDPLEVCNGLILYVLAGTLLLRLFFQSTADQLVRPYLHLPVNRSRLVHWILFRSLLTSFNILPLALFVPFAATVIAPAHGMAAGAAWTTWLFLWNLCCGYLAFLARRSLVVHPSVFVLVAGGVVGVLGADWLDLLSLSAVSGVLFDLPLSQPATLPGVLLVLAVLHGTGHRLISGHLHLEGTTPNGPTRSRWESLLPRGRGELLDLAGLELKLLNRNRRPRSALTFALAVPLVGLVAYPTVLSDEGYERWRLASEVSVEANQPEGPESSVMEMLLSRRLRAHLNLVYLGVLFTGTFMLMYGQFVVAWDSSYFEGLIARRLDFLRYLEAKYLVLILFSFFGYVICLPFLALDRDILYMNSVIFLYNLGVNCHFLLFLGTFARKRLVLEEGAMTSQGRGAAQYVILLPTMLLPLLIFLPFGLAGQFNAGYATLGLLGVLGVALRRPVLRAVARRLERKKHLIVESFRKG